MTVLRAVLVLLMLPPATFTDEFTGRVVSIADGDTVTVLRDRERVKVRLNGIDAPEKGQAFGTTARKHLGDQIAKKTVKVVWKEKDRYGRTLGDVYFDDRWIERELVRDGYAWHYTRYSKDKRLAEAETEAREKKRGLWQDREPVAPWEYRKHERDKRKK
jgi:micrococcal nuclease